MAAGQELYSPGASEALKSRTQNEKEAVNNEAVSALGELGSELFVDLTKPVLEQGEEAESLDYEELMNTQKAMNEAFDAVIAANALGMGQVNFPRFSELVKRAFELKHQQEKELSDREGRLSAEQVKALADYQNANMLTQKTEAFGKIALDTVRNLLNIFDREIGDVETAIASGKTAREVGGEILGAIESKKTYNNLASMLELKAGALIKPEVIALNLPVKNLQLKQRTAQVIGSLLAGMGQYAQMIVDARSKNDLQTLNLRMKQFDETRMLYKELDEDLKADVDLRNTYEPQERNIRALLARVDEIKTELGSSPA